MKASTLKILLITAFILVITFLSKAQVKGIPLTGSDAVSGRISYNANLSSTFKKYTLIDSNWASTHYAPLIGGGYIPLTGTNRFNPVTGIIEFRGASGITSIVDTVLDYFIGAGNLKNLGNSTIYSRINFDPTGGTTIDASDGTGVTSLSFNGSGGLTQTVNNGTNFTAFISTGTTQTIRSNYTSFAGLQEFSDYSSHYTNLSHINKGYAVTTFAPISGGAYLSSTLSNGKIYVGNGSNVGTAVTPALNSSAGTFTMSNTGQFTFPDATNSTRGFLNSTDWTTFNSKQNAITTGTTAQYVRGDLSLATFPTNVSSFTNDAGYLTTISGITAGGDLSGTYTNPRVAKINGNTIPANAAGVLTNNGSGVLSWASSTSPLSFNLPLINNTNTVSLNIGTGLANNSGTLVTNLSNLTVGYGLSGSAYNGIGAIVWKADTTPSTGLVSKSRLNAQLSGYQPTLTNPITGTGVNGQSAFFTGSTTQSSDANYFWDNTNKRLGIGNNVPASILHTVETSTAITRGINSDQYSTNTSGSRITMRKARGTFASPTTIVTGDLLGSWTASGYEGVNFIDGAKILVTSVGTIGTNTVPATMALQTASANGAMTTGLLIDQNQNVSITNSVTAGTIVKSGGTSSQFLKADGSIDANTYLTGNQTITLSGKVTGSGTTSITTSLAASQPDITTAANLTSVGTLTTVTIGNGAKTLLGSDATGDMYYNGGSGALTRLADVVAGSYLRSGGTSTAPVWSTLLLPNSLTTNNILFGSATNTVGSSTNFVWDNTNQMMTITGKITANPTSSQTPGFIIGTNNTTATYGAGTNSNGITAYNYGAGYNNAVYYGLQIRNTSSGVLASGVGAGLLFSVPSDANTFVNTKLSCYSITTPSGGDNTTINTAYGFQSAIAGVVAERFTMYKDMFGIGQAVPTAILHIKAGTATANTAPLKFTSGTNLSTTEAGAVEYNGSHLYFTAANAGTRYQLDQQGVSNYVHSISTPTTGATVNLTNNSYNIINPAGALLALTINLPSSPSNNDVVYIKFTQNITTVTYANGTVVDGITAPTAGGLTVLVYDSGTTSWY